MTACHHHFVTVCGADPVVTVSRFLGAVTANTLCPQYHTAALVAFVIYFEITGMCSVLLCLHVDEPVSGYDEGGSQVMGILKIYVVVCLFTVGCTAREHSTVTWIECDVSVGHQTLYESKF
jgi:hypothetical protein